MLGDIGEIALSQAPRILGFGDRDAASKTFGCFDRAFWHYRTADFPCATYQEASALLVRLHTGPAGSSPWAERPEVARWARAAADYWVARLHRDGSADEVYPFERSFCATAFGVVAVATTLRALGAGCPPGLARAGRWLANAALPPVANQVAASALALRLLHELTADEAFGAASERCLGALLRSQSEAGFFPEYGGYDIGYLTITLSVLARYDRLAPSPAVRTAAERALRFLEPLVRADGTYDPAGTSRGTQYLYPLGLAYFRSDLLHRLQRGLKEGRALNPLWLDDRYVIPLTTDYWDTHLLMTGASCT